MDNRKRQKKFEAKRNSANVVVTRYTMDSAVADEFRRAGSEYGSQGRALQVATEMLIRMEEPPAAAEAESKVSVRISVRVLKRTHDLVHDLAKLKYRDDPGHVIAACIEVLKMKRINL